MGIHCGLLLLIAKMSVFPVNQAVPLLPRPLTLLRLSILTALFFERGGSD